MSVLDAVRDRDAKRATRLRAARTKYERGHGPELRKSDANWLAKYEEARHSRVRALPEAERDAREELAELERPAPRQPPKLRVVKPPPPPPPEPMDRVSFDEPPAPAPAAAPAVAPEDDDDDELEDDVPVVEGEPIDDPTHNVATCGNERCHHCRKKKGLGARVESICPVTKGPIWKPMTDAGAQAFATGVFFVVGLIAMFVAKLMGHPNPKLIEPSPLELEMLVKYVKEVASNRAPWVAMFDDMFGFFGTVGLFAKRAYFEGRGAPKLASVTPIREGAGAGAGAAAT